MAYDIYDELFEDMQAGRDRLAREYNWFTHDTSHDRLAQIRKHGLLPLVHRRSLTNSEQPDDKSCACIRLVLNFVREAVTMVPLFGWPRKVPTCLAGWA